MPNSIPCSDEHRRGMEETLKLAYELQRKVEDAKMNVYVPLITPLPDNRSPAMRSESDGLPWPDMGPGEISRVRRPGRFRKWLSMRLCYVAAWIDWDNDWLFHG